MLLLLLLLLLLLAGHAAAAAAAHYRVCVIHTPPQIGTKTPTQQGAACEGYPFDSVYRKFQSVFLVIFLTVTLVLFKKQA